MCQHFFSLKLIYAIPAINMNFLSIKIHKKCKVPQEVFLQGLSIVNHLKIMFDPAFRFIVIHKRGISQEFQLITCYIRKIPRKMCNSFNGKILSPPEGPCES